MRRAACGGPPCAAAARALTAAYTDRDPHPQLLRFLIATHHGYGRPFYPPQVDPDHHSVHYHGELGDMTDATPYRIGRPESVTARDFHDTVEHYGHYGAAWLEAIVRLADHGASRHIPTTAEGS